MGEDKLNQEQLANLLDLVEKISVEETKDFGDVAVLYHLAREFGLVEILDDAAGKRNQGYSVGLLSVVMAINRLVDAKSKRQLLEWYPTTALPEITEIGGDDLSYYDFFYSLDYWDDEAIRKAESQILFTLTLKFGICFSHLVWDTASTYFEEEACELAPKETGGLSGLVQYGHSKNHRDGRPQVNFEVLLDRSHQFPLYHRGYEGNVVDVSRFPEAIDGISQQYPDLHPTIIIDRGVSNLENLKASNPPTLFCPYFKLFYRNNANLM